jgi:hypothetical protein
MFSVSRIGSVSFGSGIVGGFQDGVDLLGAGEAQQVRRPHGGDVGRRAGADPDRVVRKQRPIDEDAADIR